VPDFLKLPSNLSHPNIVGTVDPQPVWPSEQTLSHGSNEVPVFIEDATRAGKQKMWPFEFSATPETSER
jgi:hypothetical protein